MLEIGYSLSSEEHSPNDLVRHAALAEEAGFTFALVSDHFHPWIDRQGHSPFVWSVIGGLAQATSHLRLGTGVTCPTIRIHPAIIAQAAATSAVMMKGRFFLGVGTGEALNEHIFGDAWPPHARRLEMLEEAVEVIRLLWEGGEKSFEGLYYTVENARIYTLPDEPPPIMVAAAGPKMAEAAARFGDGLISTSPEADLIKEYEKAGGEKSGRYGQMTVCWAKEEAEARRIAYEWWPNVGLPGELSQELPTPKFFEQASKLVKEEDVAKAVPCGPDPGKHIEQINKFAEAGFDHVYVHQIGPDQEGFIDFYRKEILPQFANK